MMLTPILLNYGRVKLELVDVVEKYGMEAFKPGYDAEFGYYCRDNGRFKGTDVCCKRYICCIAYRVAL